MDEDEFTPKYVSKQVIDDVDDDENGFLRLAEEVHALTLRVNAVMRIFRLQDQLNTALKAVISKAEMDCVRDWIPQSVRGERAVCFVESKRLMVKVAEFGDPTLIGKMARLIVKLA